jgi:cation:H+ antiporter
MTIWLALLAVLVVIGVAGSLLSRYGDAIAEKRGLSRSWVGLALIATVTSLPELATGVTSVTFAAAPDIAVGDVLGSCVFNLLILVFLDFLYRKEPVYTLARHGHIVSAGFGTAMIGFVGFNLLLYGQGFAPSLLGVGLYAPMLVLIYALAMRTLFRYERAQVGEFVEQELTYPGLTMPQAVAGYAASAAVVIAAGVALPFVGTALAAEMGWGTTFVGTLFVAAVTSAPEAVVTVAALRLGAVDMAMGNLLGSNLFNLVILAVDDVFYASGPLFADVSEGHVASVLSAAMMGGLAITGLVLRPRSRVLRTVSWVSVLLLATYLLNVLFLYLHHAQAG